MLDYGHAEPARRRWTRYIPWPSAWTVLLALAAALTIGRLCVDHDAWVLIRTFSTGFSSLQGCVSPDGMRIVVGSASTDPGNAGALSICDTLSGKTISNLAGTDAGARPLAFSPDGKRLLTVGTDTRGTLASFCLWDAAIGKRIARLDPEENLPPSSAQAVFSPDGLRIAILESSFTELCDGKTGQWIGTMGRANPADLSYIGNDIFFSPDSTSAVIRMSGPAPVCIYATTDGHLVAKQHTALDDLGGDTMQGDFSPDGKVFAFSDGRWLQCIDVASGGPIFRSLSTCGVCWRLWYSPDGRLLYSLNNVGFWGSGMLLTELDSFSGQFVAKSKVAFDVSTRVATSPNGCQIAMSSGAGVDLLNAQTLRTIGRLVGSWVGYSNQPFSPDGSRLIAIQNWPARAIELVDTSTGWYTSTIRDRRPGITGYFTDAIFAGDGSHLITATDSGINHVWYRRRPEGICGLMALPAFWLASLAGSALSISCRRDYRRWKRPSERWKR